MGYNSENQKNAARVYVDPDGGWSHRGEEDQLRGMPQEVRLRRSLLAPFVTMTIQDGEPLVLPIDSPANALQGADFQPLTAIVVRAIMVAIREKPR